jgi:hypothetical protein
MDPRTLARLWGVMDGVAAAALVHRFGRYTSRCRPLPKRLFAHDERTDPRSKGPVPSLKSSRTRTFYCIYVVTYDKGLNHTYPRTREKGREVTAVRRLIAIAEAPLRPAYLLRGAI